MKMVGIRAQVLGVALTLVSFLANLPPASAQSLADPVMGWLRIAVTCEGTSLTSGQAELHFHGFGGPRVGAPREVSPPRLQCTPDDPVAELAVHVAIPPIWHVYLTPTSSTGSSTCEKDGTTLPVAERCGDPVDGVTIEISVVSLDS